MTLRWFSLCLRLCYYWASVWLSVVDRMVFHYSLYCFVEKMKDPMGTMPSPSPSLSSSPDPSNVSEALDALEQACNDFSRKHWTRLYTIIDQHKPELSRCMNCHQLTDSELIKCKDEDRYTYGCKECAFYCHSCKEYSTDEDSHEQCTPWKCKDCGILFKRNPEVDDAIYCNGCLASCEGCAGIRGDGYIGRRQGKHQPGCTYECCSDCGTCYDNKDGNGADRHTCPICISCGEINVYNARDGKYALMCEPCGQSYDRIRYRTCDLTSLDCIDKRPGCEYLEDPCQRCIDSIRAVVPAERSARKFKQTNGYKAYVMSEGHCLKDQTMPLLQRKRIDIGVTYKAPVGLMFDWYPEL